MFASRHPGGDESRRGRALSVAFIYRLEVACDRNSPSLPARPPRVLTARGALPKEGSYQHFCSLNVVEVAGIEPASFNL